MSSLVTLFPCLCQCREKQLLATLASLCGWSIQTSCFLLGCKHYKMAQVSMHLTSTQSSHGSFWMTFKSLTPCPLIACKFHVNFSPYNCSMKRTIANYSHWDFVKILTWKRLIRNLEGSGQLIFRVFARSKTSRASVAVRSTIRGFVLPVWDSIPPCHGMQKWKPEIHSESWALEEQDSRQKYIA